LNSNVNNKTEETSTLSITEMIGFIVIVGSALYLLYPKSDIKELLNKKTEENTQLSIDYLNNMLMHNPNNVELQYKLIEKYSLNGEADKALILINKLIATTTNPDELKKLFKSEYLFLKKQYFQTKDKAETKKPQLAVLEEKLSHLFHYAKDNDAYNFLLHESTSMDFIKLRYKSFSYLLRKEPITLKVKEDALRFFISYNKLEEAEPLVMDLLEKESNQEKSLEYFKTAFYLLAQDKVKNREKIEKIIQIYREKNPLSQNDLYLLSNIYLQMNQKKEAAEFIYSSFKSHPELFDEKSSYEAIRILSYNSQLKRALEVSNFTDKKYPSQKSLDSLIQLSIWLSKSKEAITFNIQGWQVYKDVKYKKYLLEKTTLDNAYKIRGKIYKQAIANGDFSMVKKMGEYYEYTGEIDKAENYFNTLLKKYPKKNIYQEAIRFSHDNGNFENVDNLYKNYRKKFGIDREIHKKVIDEFIVTKQINRAYTFTKELKNLGKEHKQIKISKEAGGHQHNHHHIEEKDYSATLKQLASIEQDYPYLYDLLWKDENNFTKTKNNYAMLINLESKLSKKPRLEYLYKKAWATTGDSTYLPLLFSLYIDKKEYKKFEEILNSLKAQERDALEKLSYFQILLANYYQGIRQPKLALASFKKAITLEPDNGEIHQAYLWFLLNRDYYSELQNEINLLKRNSKLQKKTALPSVVAALKLNKSDLAYKWLKPLLKQERKSPEYQALYADILEFQGEKDKAQAIRFRLFKSMHKKVKSKKELLKDKEFAQLYLQMALSYKFPYSKKNQYMKKFKSLFSKKEYLEIELGLYSSYNMVNKISNLVHQHKLNYPWINLYLATQRKDKAFAKKAYKENFNTFSLKDKISIAIESEHKDHAYTLLFNSMNENQNSISLATTYWRLINDEFPKSKFSIRSEHLSKEISQESMNFSTKYSLNSKLNIGVDLLQNNYIQQNKDDFTERAFGLSLSNHDSNFLWSLNLGRYFGDYHYNYSKFMMHYNLEYTSIELNIKNNNRTELTPKLQTYGLEDSIKLDFTYNLDERNLFGLSYQQNNYHLKDGEFLGKGKVIQLSNTQLFRLGYPNITLFNYLNIENFDFEDKKMGLSSFTEMGSEITIGDNAKNTLYKSWKPYMSLGMALNDHKQIGSSVTMGVAGMLYRADKLDFSLRYIKGINNLNEEIYGAYLNYNY